MKTYPYARLAALALLALLPAAAPAAGDLAPMLKDGSFFTTPLSGQASFRGERFAWVVKDRQMRFPQPGFSLGPVKPGETLLLVADGKPSGLRVSLYNRGDDGALSDEAFAARHAAAVKAVAELAGSEGEAFRRKTDPTKQDADVAGRRWTSPGAAYSLEWAVARKGTDLVPLAEYLRLDVLPAGAAAGAQPGAAQGGRRTDPRSHVARGDDGTVELRDVPMVDQGQKGYCAAATVARIMGYYGYDFLDQHQIASWAKSDADRGTNEKMLDAIAGVLHDRYKLVYREVPGSVNDFFKLVEEYNKAAKRLKKPEVSLKPMPGTRVIDAGAVWRQFQPDVLREARTRNQTRNNLFFDNIRKSIDAGVPVIWSAMLGLVPEDPPLPQAFGGHMRLIIGYNAKDRTILYTDSWGARHERKTMRLEDAILITTGLRTIAWTLN